MASYESFARVYDLFMDNIPYEDWCRYLHQVLEKYGVSDGLVLELGCGTGTMTELLADCGYDMIGIDNSPDMLEIAMEKRIESGKDILYLMQDMREFELYGTVRAIVSVCDSINYVTEEEDLLEVFRLADNYLDPNGILVFDLRTVANFERIGESVIAENREESSFIWENWYDSEDRINEYDLTLFIRNEDDLYEKYEETHYQKAWDLNSVFRLIEQAGMKLEACYDAFTWEQPDEKSERVYVIAREQKKAAEQKTAAE